MNVTLRDLQCWECGQVVPDGGPCPGEHPGYSHRAARSRGYVYWSGVIGPYRDAPHTREAFARRRNERAEAEEMAVRERMLAECDRQIDHWKVQREVALDVLRRAQTQIATLQVRRDRVARTMQPRERAG